MTIHYEVHPLFPKPLYKTKVDVGLSKEAIDFILHQEMYENPSNSISINKNLLESPVLEKLNESIHVHLNIFLKEIMGAKDCEAYITQSWSLMNMPGHGMHEHSHSNSLISGSYYFTDMPEPGSDMVFNRYTGNQSRLKLNLDEEKISYYNMMNMPVQMEKHDLFLFPSDVSHQIEKNQSTEPRYSIAFNSFVKGKLGDYDYANLLIVK
jgi:uncharacterized protein (TIGR02466 family)